MVRAPRPLFAIIALIVIAVDQFFKYFIPHLEYPITFGFLSIRLAHNTGAGFGLLQGYTWLLALISLIVAGAVIVFYKLIPKDRQTQIMWALFFGGVVGNLLDRLFRGYVIDFIDFGF